MEDKEKDLYKAEDCSSCCPHTTGESACVKIVGIKLPKGGRIYDYKCNNLPLRVGDVCVVETERGLSLGEVALSTRAIPRQKTGKLKSVIRRATPKDMEKGELLNREERNAYQVCLEKIARHKLVMKLVKVEFVDSENKIIFYFTADGRVDFRALVKDLASHFRKRIEMRQIGVRDEARMVGGMGSCGNKLCCTTFIKNFEPVTIKMAKEQALALNPHKISGVCGRLLCCLMFEHRQYKDLRKRVPGQGKRVKTPDGIGRVVKANLLMEKVTVQLEDERLSEYDAGRVEIIS